MGVGTLAPGGVWHGNLYLRGSGDPTFGSGSFIRSYYGSGDGASVGDLALRLRRSGLRRVDGRILGDESFFDSDRGGPRTGFGYDPDLTGVLSALAFNRGQSGRVGGPHAPAAYAALQLAGTLRRLGVKITGASGAGLTPPDATALARVQSPTLSTLLRLQNGASDNFFAEMLVKVLGARFGGAGTTSAGAAVVRRTISALGLHPQVVDGSGLSRADSTSPHDVVTLLTRIFDQPLGTTLRSTLAVAGQSGTLRLRMRGTAAAGRCQAKTGTLIGVSNLAGWCDAAGGDTLAFAVEMDGIGESSAHTLQDNMTITLARFADAGT
jgi:D-alanyl-D-alanine carboxypeptidase/D-alanyl-D-alanine-endopeptidase (penicillin-binding protein 4)